MDERYHVIVVVVGEYACSFSYPGVGFGKKTVETGVREIEI